MRVLVCGGTDYRDKRTIWHCLDAFGPPEITEVISGMAPGTDTIAAEWAERFGFPLHKFPADWKKHGRAAGPIRNAEMLYRGKPDAVIAFPGGRGTLDMIAKAERAGIRVHKIGW